MQLQHGDVLITKVEQLPDDIKLVSNDNIILAKGEVTGHNHRVQGKAQLMVQERNDTKYFFLIVLEPVTVTHEEHKPIELEAGNYQISQVREFDYIKEMERRVVD